MNDRLKAMVAFPTNVFEDGHESSLTIDSIIRLQPAHRNDVGGAEAGMFQEEKTFTVRFSLEANFPEDYEGDEDNHVWVQDWERRIKPEVIKVIFGSLRQHPTWTAHVRNRGLSPLDEIEIAMVKTVSQDPLRST
jgi:hypothetical protein